MSIVFKMKFKPTKVELSSKYSIRNHLPRNMNNGYKNNLSGYFDDDYVYLYNLEKRNKKSKLLKSYGYNEHGKYQKRKVICEHHWVGYIYKIPLSVGLNLAVKIPGILR